MRMIRIGLGTWILADNSNCVGRMKFICKAHHQAEAPRRFTMVGEFASPMEEPGNSALSVVNPKTTHCIVDSG